MRDNKLQAAINTDRELYREDRHDPLDPDNYYAPKVFVTQDGQIGMDTGGLIIIHPIAVWRRLAQRENEQGENMPANVEVKMVMQRHTGWRRLLSPAYWWVRLAAFITGQKVEVLETFTIYREK